MSSNKKDVNAKTPDAAVADKAKKETKQDVVVVAGGVAVQVDPALISDIVSRSIQGLDKGKIAKAITGKVEREVIAALSKDLAPAMAEAVSEAVRTEAFKGAIRDKVSKLASSIIGEKKTSDTSSKGVKKLGKKKGKVKLL